MYERILLPLDGSATAEEAVPHAIAQAKSFQAELILLRVLEPLPVDCCVPPAIAERAEEEATALARGYLEGVAVPAREQGILVRVATARGRPHVEVTHLAEANEIDLIVMCSHGRSGVGQLLMGSVASHLLREAKVPVLVVRASGNTG